MSEEINRFAPFDLGDLVHMKSAMLKYSKGDRTLLALLDELGEELKRKHEAIEADPESPGEYRARMKVEREANKAAKEAGK